MRRFNLASFLQNLKGIVITLSTIDMFCLHFPSRGMHHIILPWTDLNTCFNGLHLSFYPQNCLRLRALENCRHRNAFFELSNFNVNEL